MQNHLYPFILINLGARFETCGKEYEFGRSTKKGIAFVIPEIVFPSNWMADVYARNYIESVFLRYYYLICIGIPFSIFRSRCRRELLREQILKYSEE